MLNEHSVIEIFKGNDLYGDLGYKGIRGRVTKVDTYEGIVFVNIFMMNVRTGRTGGFRVQAHDHDDVGHYILHNGDLRTKLVVRDIYES